MSKRVIPLVPPTPATFANEATPVSIARPKMPVDRFAMMRQVNQEANTAQFDTVSAGQNHRDRKEQEAKRRHEVALMEKEDYTFTQEGVERLKRREARLLMDAEEKLVRKLLAAEAAARYQAMEKERKRLEAEERQKLLEQHRLQMEEQRKKEAEELERKKLEREQRLKKMKEDADRKVREEYLKKEEAKKMEIERVRQLEQQQMERIQMEAEEEFERNRLVKEAEQLAIQERIKAEELKWKAWEEAEAQREANEMAARRALLAAQYEEDKARRMDLHRLRKEKESRLKKMEQPVDEPLPESKESPHKGIPKVGSFIVKPENNEKLPELKDITTMTKDQLKEEQQACVVLKKQLKQDIVSWCDAFQAKMNRPPSLEEKQEIQPLYKRYSEVESQYRAVKKRLESIEPKHSASQLTPVQENAPLKISTSPSKSATLPPTNDAPMIHIVLTNRKKEIKKAIQDWTNAFQQSHGKMPSVQEKKEILPLYEEYAKIDNQLKSLKHTGTTDSTTPHKKISPKRSGSQLLDMQAIKEMAAKHSSTQAMVNQEKKADGLIEQEQENEDRNGESSDTVAISDIPQQPSEQKAAPEELVQIPEEPSPNLDHSDTNANDTLMAPTSDSQSPPAPEANELPSVVCESPEKCPEELVRMSESEEPQLQTSELNDKETKDEPVEIAEIAPPPIETHTTKEWIQLEFELLDTMATLESTERLNTIITSLHSSMGMVPPFLRVDSVEKFSPAAQAGLLAGDLIVRFGSVLLDQGQPNSVLIREVVALVNERASCSKTIGISIIRDDDKYTHLLLQPQKWAGNGLLGCVLQPYDASKVQKTIIATPAESIPSPTIPPPATPPHTISPRAISSQEPAEMQPESVAPSEEFNALANEGEIVMQSIKELLNLPEPQSFEDTVDREMQLWDARDQLISNNSPSEQTNPYLTQLDEALAMLVSNLQAYLNESVIPFLKVESVEDDSPAAISGLQPSDLIVRFGAVVSREESNEAPTSFIQAIVGVVGARINRMLSISILRDQELQYLTLRPQKWSGNGYLGCVLQPYEQPVIQATTTEPFTWPANAFAYIESLADGTSPANLAGLVEHDFIVGFEGLDPQATLSDALMAFNNLTNFPLTLYMARYQESGEYFEFAIELNSWDGILSIQPLVQIESEPQDEPAALPSVPFAQVKCVYPDSPADHGGLMAGDYVYGITDVLFPSPEAVSDWIGNQFSMSAPVVIQIMRFVEDENRYAQIHLSIVPERWCGRQLQLNPLDRRMIELLGWQLTFLEEPVYPPYLIVSSVDKGSPAFNQGILAGDLIGKFGQVLKATLVSSPPTIEEIIKLFLLPEMELSSTIYLQIHRYNISNLVNEIHNIAIEQKPSNGVLGCQLNMWAPEKLEPLLVITSSSNADETIGFCDGDIIVQANDVQSPAICADIVNSICSRESMQLILQRWDAQQYQYIYFPLVLSSNQAELISDDELLVGGWCCMTYEKYWQRYENEHPSALPCKECWEANFATVAHGAAYRGHLDCLTYLSQYFDVYCVDPLGRTPLFYAAYANQVDCILLLLSLDEEATLREAVDINGDTILHAATSGGALQAMQLLMQHGISPESVNSLGLRPVHIAPTMEALQVLAEGQADLLAVDSSGRMALTYACIAGDEICVAYLAAECLEFATYPDNDGNTPLHHAVLNGSLSCVKAILEQFTNGYKLESNKDGLTALDLAVQGKMTTITEYLESTIGCNSESNHVE